MVKPSIFITFRVTDVEKEVLKKYCEKTGRQQSDVLREFVRSLSKISDCN
jgi:predicted DNA-binding protein